MHEVTEEEVTQQSGDVRRSFKLVDDAGAWVWCTALGRRVGNPAFADDEGPLKVILYSGFGREGEGSTPNSVWLFDGSVLVPLPDASPCLHLRQEIVWGDTQ